MLYHIFYSLHNYLSVLNVFRYITFRTIYATITALLICFIFGESIIKRLKTLKVGQYILEEGPAWHEDKQGTPTMGGILIIFATIIPALLWMDYSNKFLWIVIFTTLSFGFVGFIDDYKKLAKRENKGLSAKSKFSLQIIFAFIISFAIYKFTHVDTVLTVPFFKNFRFDLGIFYIPFAMLVIIGSSNAVNLTDGLDGLAIGPVIIASATFMILAYCSGNYKIAQYLHIPFIRGVGEFTIYSGAMLGAGIGFLWFNTYPAQVFMGDVGSLSLGATLGVAALVTKNELLLIIIGGVFVMETLSVIIQVLSYKTTGKRVFRMAPIHHHFELKGWKEPKIIVRFWIISFLLSLVAISTLKLR
jgi:phospho-N-acetylmuramoyl-pentapeptide-transferase